MAAVKYDPFFGPSPANAAKIRNLIANQRLNEARGELPKLTTAAKQRRDQGEWAWSLVEAAQIESAMVGPQAALQKLTSESWPDHLVSRTALALMKAKFQAELAAPGASTNGLTDLGAPSLEDRQLTREDVLLSLQEAWNHRSELGQEPTTRLSALLEPGNYPKGIRDTLRDFVSYKTAEVLTEHRLWTPEETAAVWGFDLAAIASASPEAVAAIPPTDEAVHPLRRAVAVLADLEAWHRSRDNHAAALEARLQRLRILRAECGSETRRATIREALRTLVSTSKAVPWLAYGYAEFAEQLRSDLPEDPSQAVDIAREGKRLYPASMGGQQCDRLVWEMTQPSFQARVMPYSAPGQPSLHIQYRNHRSLQAYAYPSDLEKGAEVAERLAQSGKLPTLRDFILAGHQGWPSYAWKVPLSATADYRLRDTIVTPPLKKPGLYWIALSPHWFFLNDWGYHQNGTMMLSDLNLQTREDPKGALNVTAVSWTSGKPLAGLPVILYQATEPDSNKQHGTRMVPMQGQDFRYPCARLTGVTDSAGRVSFKMSPKMTGPRLLVAHSGDQWAIQEGSLDPYRDMYRSARKGPSSKTIIATDRAIYRPGQTVHWKVFALQGHRQQGEVKTAAGRQIAVTLTNLQRGAIASQSVVTNEHGTASGHFRLPLVGLRGGARIGTTDGYDAEVKIEEYRRPTFTVSLEAPSRRSLTAPFVLTGKANLTNGRPLMGGTADWEIRREQALTLGSAGSWLVATGKASLGSNGSVSIPFDPRTDVAGDAGGGDRLYTVSAKVVSLSGETRKASRPFYLGSPSVSTTLTANAGFFGQSVRAQFRAQRTDLDGLPLPGEGSWKVLELRQPASPSAADAEVSSVPMINFGGMEQLAQQGVPYDADKVMQAWPDGLEVRSGSVRHGDGGMGNIDAGLLPPGAYRIKYESRDPFGSRFENSREFVVAGGGTPLALNAALFTDKATASVGSILKVLVASGHPDQTFRLMRYRENEFLDERVFNTSQLRGPIELPITNADRGGFNLVLSTVRDHRELICQQHVGVPWNKTLAVSLAGPQAIVAPGSRQKWSAHVEGRGGAPVPKAEVLATMVDRSLEAFGPHSPPDLSSELPTYQSPTQLAPNFSALGVFEVGGHDLFPSAPPSKNRLEADQLRSDNSYVGLWGMLNTPLGAIAPGALAEGRHGAGLPPRRMPIPRGQAPVESDVRRNFSETAFFLPHLVTDRNGKAKFEFTVPDSMTGWNVDLLALTPDFRSGSTRQVVQARRDLTVRLTVPRFLREGDEAWLTAELDNATPRPLAGSLSLAVRDAASGKDLATAFGLGSSAHAFRLKPGESGTIPLAIRVPKGTGQVTFTATGRANGRTDGEERTLPVLPARLHLAEGRSATLRDPGRVELSFDEVPPDPKRTSERVVLTVHSNLLASLLAAVPGLEARPAESCDELIERFLPAALIGQLLEQDPKWGLVARKAAKRGSAYQPFDLADANRTMLLDETPWASEAKGGGPGTQLLDPKTARRVRDEVLSELKSRQQGGGFSWFPGDQVSRRVTLRVLEGLAEASRAGDSSGDLLLQQGLDLLGRNFRTDATYWQENWEGSIRLAYVCSSVSAEQRQAAKVDAALMQAMLDEGYKHWKQAPLEVAGRLAIALHRQKRTAEAKQVWEGVMDLAVGPPAQGSTLSNPLPNRRLLGSIAGQAFALRALLELNPSDPRAQRLAERLALQMELAQQRSARVAAEGIVSMAAYLRHQGISASARTIGVDYSSVRRQVQLGSDSPVGKRQIVFKLNGPSAPARMGISQAARGTTLATATWHFQADQAGSGSQWPGSEVSRSYYVLRGSGGKRTWVPLQPGSPLRVGDEVRVRLQFKLPFPLGQIGLRDPRPAGLEPVDVTSGLRWFEDGPAYQEVRDNRTSFYFERLTEGSHVVNYAMRAATPGKFHAAPATLEPLWAPEFQAYSRGAELNVRGLND